MFERQWLHALALAVLLGGLWAIGASRWVWLAAWIAVAHQVYVWLCWRAELHARLLTRTLGRHAFTAYAVGFAILGISRVVAVFAVAIVERDTLGLDPLLLKAAALVVLAPALYLFYSVKRYFTFRRAFGIDHFDPAYRVLPFVRQGIFRFTRNGMYAYGFLLMWFPGLWWASGAALAAAAFNHLYIWVHYHATELPDMARIYGPARASGKSG
ncbi:MAG: methyltransferase [Betaproteobacteria bacterium]